MRRVDWRTASFLIGTPILAAILTPWYFIHYGIEPAILIFAFLYWGVGSFAITGGYHRLFTHRSYQVPDGVKIAFLILAAGQFQGPALRWCTDHRKHHRFADTDRDPHNIKKGFWWAHVAWLFYDDTTPFEQEFLNDKYFVWQNRYYVPLALIVGFGMPTFVGWLLGSAMGGFLIGGLLRVVVSHHCTFFINSLCHMVGTRPYSDKDTARDSFIMAILAYGEGYHNYHHRFQSDYRNGIRWYQWDPTKWGIALLHRMGLASDLMRISNEDIVRAMLTVDHTRSINLGAPAERLQLLKEKVERAQLRMRELRDDYQRLKADFSSASKQRYESLKVELRIARLEYRTAWRAWVHYIKYCRKRRPLLAINSRRGTR